MSNKEIAQILRKAARAGCSCERTNGSHIKVTTPSGAVYFTASTGGRGRGTMNLQAWLRKNGVQT